MALGSSEQRVEGLLQRRWGAAIVALLGGAVVPTAAQADTLASLRDAAPGMVTRTDVSRSAVRFAHTRGGVRGVSGPKDAARFLRVHGQAFGLAGDIVARPATTTRDALGHTRVHFDAVYRGVPVFGAGWSLHFEPGGDLIAVRASAVPGIGVSEVPSFGGAEAGVLAVDAVPGADFSSHSALYVFDRGLVTGQSPDPRLAYRVIVEGDGQRHEVFIDAHGGDVLLVASQIPHELERRVYDSEYAAGNLLWQESDGPYVGGDSSVEDFNTYTQDTYALYENISGGAYLSFDGASAAMEGVVHYDTDCPNASWNGTSTNYCNGLVTDDVVAHEWAHAYTQQNHQLIYAYQPGALNEAYSDIFGEAVDLLNDSGDGPHTVRGSGNCVFGGNNSERWLIGEETSGLGGAIRDMWEPTCFNHPGRVSDSEYICSGSDFFDNGGVHINSGVPNHAFALLVDGGTSNGQSVPAIGMTKALAIYWRAMTTYQVVTSGFPEHADALIASCEDLVASAEVLPDPVSGGVSGEVMSPADCTAVSNAITATELLEDPGCGSGTLLETAGAPALCGDTDGEPVSVFEASFEDGLEGWTPSHQGVFDSFEPRDWVLRDDLPQGREGQGVFATGDLYIGHCSVDDESGVLRLESPSFALPAEDVPVVLHFEHWVATQPRQDGGNIKISRNGGPFTLVTGSAFLFNSYTGTIDAPDNPLASQPAFTGSDPGLATGTWVSSQIDLRQVAEPGDDLVIRLDFGVDACNGLFGWYVDDVEVTACLDAVESTTGDSETGSSTTGLDSGGTAADASTSDPTDSSTSADPSDTLDPTMDSANPSGGDSDGGSSSGGDASATDVDQGCACSAGESTGGWSWLALVFGFGVVRRRRS